MARDDSIDRRKFLGSIGAAGILGTAGCISDIRELGGGGGGGTWTLGTSAEGSSSFRIGSTWTEYFRREDLFEEVEVEAIVTEGTGATYRMVDSGEVEIGGTTTQLLDASPDQGPYEDSPLEDFENIRQVRGYMGFFNFGLVDTEQGVEGWDDLEGESIVISSSGSATRAPVERIVDEEIGLDNVDNRYMAFSDIPGALRSGQVAAAFTWTVNEDIPQGWFQEIDATVEWAPLELSQETQDLLDELTFASYVELDEETVGSFSENYQGPLDTFTLTYLYVTKADRDPAAVKEIARLTHQYGEELLEEDDVMGFFPDPDQFIGLLHPEIPFHQGAYEYYQEEGLWEEYDMTAPPEAEE